MDDRDLQLMRRLRDGSPISPDEVGEARRALQAAIEEEIASGRRSLLDRLRLPALPTFTRVRAFTAAAAAIAVIVLAAVTLQSIRPPSAVAALTEIAEVAATIEPPVAAPGDAVYTRSDRTELVQLPGEDVPGAGVDVVSFLLPQTREVWVRPDGSRRLQIDAREPVFFDDDVREAFFAAGLSDVFGIGRVEVIDFAPPDVDLRPDTLPLDSDALRATLFAEAAGVGGDAPVEIRALELAGAYLRETTATGPTRAALIETIATLPGIEVVDDREDFLEVGISYTTDGATFRRTLRLDRATSAMTRESVILLTGDPDLGVPDGTPLVEAAYTVPTVVTLP